VVELAGRNERESKVQVDKDGGLIRYTDGSWTNEDAVVKPASCNKQQYSRENSMPLRFVQQGIYAYSIWNLGTETCKLYNTHRMIKGLLINRSVLNWSGIVTNT